MIAGLDEVFGDRLVKTFAVRAAPDGGDEGKAGEDVPLLGEVVVDELFTGANKTVGALFESQQGGVADEDGGVGTLEHGVKVGGRGRNGTSGLPQ